MAQEYTIFLKSEGPNKLFIGTDGCIDSFGAVTPIEYYWGILDSYGQLELSRPEAQALVDTLEAVEISISKFLQEGGIFTRDGIPLLIADAYEDWLVVNCTSDILPRLWDTSPIVNEMQVRALEVSLQKSEVGFIPLISGNSTDPECIIVTENGISHVRIKNRVGRWSNVFNPLLIVDNELSDGEVQAEKIEVVAENEGAFRTNTLQALGLALGSKPMLVKPGAASRIQFYDGKIFFTQTNGDIVDQRTSFVSSLSLERTLCDYLQIQINLNRTIPAMSFKKPAFIRSVLRSIVNN
jgi:hypothetical protein